MSFGLMGRALFYVIAAVLIFFGYIRLVEQKTLFIPYRDIALTPKDVGLAYEDIYLEAQDQVRLNAWLIKAELEPWEKPTFLILHGNAGNLSNRVEKIRRLHDVGVNVFIIDYRGYGRSQGSPSEEGLYKDARAAFDYLVARRDLSGEKIIPYGVSLGGAVAVDLAVSRPIHALILESTFTSAKDMGKVVLPLVPSFLLSVRLDSISKIKAVEKPKLVFHSPEDEVVPYRLGKRLFDAAAEPKKFVKLTGSHNDGFLVSEQVIADSVRKFLEGYQLW